MYYIYNIYILRTAECRGCSFDYCYTDPIPEFQMKEFSITPCSGLSIKLICSSIAPVIH